MNYFLSLFMKTTDKIKLLLAKSDLIKLKSTNGWYDYAILWNEWQKNVESMLQEIDTALREDKIEIVQIAMTQDPDWVPYLCALDDNGTVWDLYRWKWTKNPPLPKE